ncbi:MAG: bis(5'-nucleosyl)-tetraphosphatase (symmetrical) YqeK, partial [Clostridia bacterium]|nr:bis(5'-nucleosyl)-tetraphosphatase (symmetrical) YqeK [Clostridia bacterium]
HDFSPQIVSSTDVRNAIANGDDISDLVPKKVEEYIKNNALYAPFDLKKAEEILRSRVNEKRYAHCLGVAKTAVYLAEKYGADPKKAEIAGLLHDITKNLSNSEQIVYCRENGIPLDENELYAPQVIHAKTAEFFVRTELGLSDEEILSAIRYHTTGRAGMTLLDKIIYVSDFIEPTRDYSDVDHYRALADENLDTALLEGLKWIICNAVTNNKPMHPAAIEMFNNLVNNK